MFVRLPSWQTSFLPSTDAHSQNLVKLTLGFIIIIIIIIIIMVMTEQNANEMKQREQEIAIVITKITRQVIMTRPAT